MLKDIFSMGIGTILGCVLTVNAPAQQSNARHEGNSSESTSSPSENPQIDDKIDYENAKPMPLPSLPDGPNPNTPPGIPSIKAVPRHPGVSPGGTGKGEENPQVLVPPKSPLPDTDPANDIDETQPE